MKLPEENYIILTVSDINNDMLRCLIQSPEIGHAIIPVVESTHRGDLRFAWTFPKSKGRIKQSKL